MSFNPKTSAALTNLCFIFLVLVALACNCQPPDNRTGGISRGNNNSPRQDPQNTDAGTTTVYLVRHAEKAAEPANDPALTVAGEARAFILMHELADKNVAAIYTSQFTRTKATAKPLAQQIGITPIEINDAAQIAESILSNNRGQTVLVVGHSNTVPKIIEILGGNPMNTIPETEFDNMYVLTLTQFNVVNVTASKY